MGISLVGHAGRVLDQLDWVDARLISTDDEQIAAEGKAFHLDAPFLRPPSLATDTATSLDMWQHAWRVAEEYYRRQFDISMLIEPTSPLRRPGDLEKTVLSLIDNGHGAAVTVSPTPAHFSPEKTLVLNPKGRLAYYVGDRGRQFHNRQAIPSYYHRNGICYAVCRDYLMEEGLIIDDAVPVVIDRPIVNIDDPFELELAEWLMKRSSGGE